MTMGRTADRAEFPDPMRIRLLEKDADECDISVDKLRADLNTSAADLRSDMAALRQVLVGILVAVTVASIMLAINLVVKA